MQNTRVQDPSAVRKTLVLQVEIRDGLTNQTEVQLAVWSGTAVRYWRAPYTQAHIVFADSTHGLS